jgi:hypothetical protein
MMYSLSNPLFCLKVLPNLIINLNTHMTPSMKDTIHLHHVREKPFILKVCYTKDQLILSYIFSKLILKIIPFCFILCILCIVLYNTITHSIIFLPDKKTIWDGLMTF